MTNAPITQAVVTVTVSAGCEKRLWRRYTLKALPSTDQPTARPASTERQWPEVEEQANTLAAQGLLGTAVDLVMNYVRSARRAHLMPYLKLLQLQRRRGDRAAFDDTRTLLEQNFKLPLMTGRRHFVVHPR